MHASQYSYYFKFQQSFGIALHLAISGNEFWSQRKFCIFRNLIIFHQDNEAFTKILLSCLVEVTEQAGLIGDVGTIDIVNGFTMSIEKWHWQFTAWLSEPNEIKAQHNICMIDCHICKSRRVDDHCENGSGR